MDILLCLCWVSLPIPSPVETECIISNIEYEVTVHKYNYYYADNEYTVTSTTNAYYITVVFLDMRIKTYKIQDDLGKYIIQHSFVGDHLELIEQDPSKYPDFKLYKLGNLRY
jgi:hypothetical protein